MLRSGRLSGTTLCLSVCLLTGCSKPTPEPSASPVAQQGALRERAAVGRLVTESAAAPPPRPSEPQDAQAVAAYMNNFRTFFERSERQFYQQGMVIDNVPQNLDKPLPQYIQEKDLEFRTAVDQTKGLVQQLDQMPTPPACAPIRDRYKARLQFWITHLETVAGMLQRINIAAQSGNINAIQQSAQRTDQYFAPAQAQQRARDEERQMQEVQQASRAIASQYPSLPPTVFTLEKPR